MKILQKVPTKALVACMDFHSAHPARFQILPSNEAFVSAFDRSFHFGDSIYEVTRSYGGILFSLDEHLKRLQNSANESLFEEPLDLDLIKTMTEAACKAYFQRFGTQTEVYVRICVSSGIGDLNIDRDTGSHPYPMVIVKELPLMPASRFEEGYHYAIVQRRRNLKAALDPAMKSGNYLNNVLALREAKKMGAEDAILLDYQGFVTEGTTNNIFAVFQDEIWTAPLSIGILEGITRNWIMQACQRLGIPLSERIFTETDLWNASEIFLSSSIKEVMPITKINHRLIADGKPGPLTRKLSTAFQAIIAEYCEQKKSQSLYV